MFLIGGELYSVNSILDGHFICEGQKEHLEYLGMRQDYN